jgi:hypothetical protein
LPGRAIETVAPVHNSAGDIKMILQDKAFLRVSHPETGLSVVVDTYPYRSSKEAYVLAIKIIKSKLVYLKCKNHIRRFYEG